MHSLVKRSNIDDDGKSIGKEHSNPLIDTIAYTFEFVDVTTETLTANIIA